MKFPFSINEIVTFSFVKKKDTQEKTKINKNLVYQSLIRMSAKKSLIRKRFLEGRNGAMQHKAVSHDELSHFSMPHGNPEFSRFKTCLLAKTSYVGSCSYLHFSLGLSGLAEHRAREPHRHILLC